MNRINLCCLFGGESSEYEVSLRTAAAMLSNIDGERYDVCKVGITKSGNWYFYEGTLADIENGSWCADERALRPAFLSPSKNDRCLYIISADGSVEKQPIDVILPAVHGTNCEDGVLQGLMQLTGIPFVGSDCLASAVCMDKATTKSVLMPYHIPQAKAIFASATDLECRYDTLADEVAGLGYPVFVKPSSAGSSVGVSKVKSPDSLRAAIEEALRFDKKVLIEEFIKGREIEVAVMGNETPVASVCGEIDPGSEFYDYDSKYITDSASYFIPARLESSLADEIRACACEIYRRLGCRGLSRVDFFVKDDGSFIFNEINTLPGFTSISMYPKLFMAGGMTYSEVINSLITLALEK